LGLLAFLNTRYNGERPVTQTISISDKGKVGTTNVIGGKILP
jgi:hypothetical protein